MGFKVQFSGNNKFKVNLKPESTTADVNSKSAVYIHGDDGATFYPEISPDADLSWTNDKGLENPPTVNIRGPQGAQGEPGQKGEVGAQGPQGPQGEQGPQGPEGARGPQGIQGERGAQGPKGDKGDIGPQGVQGLQGIQGIRGEKGDKGDTGPQGQKGDKGDRGEQGIQGVQGAKGETGAQGQKGADGTSATHRWSGTTLYITSASGTSSANLKGEKGDKGEKGEKGADGTMTFEDLTAEQKASLKGDKGDKGDPGIDGKDGADGQPGKDGSPGKDGYTPVKGKDYFDGKDGKDGVNGKDGYTPVKGVDYFDGQNGQPGKDGADGISPVVAVEDIDGGHRVTITDKDGAKQFDVMDGKDGEGGSGAEVHWDDVQGKPFGEMPTGGDTLYWDGNTEGLLEIASDAGTFYKVSDVVLTEDDFFNTGSYEDDIVRISGDSGVIFSETNDDVLDAMFAELGFGIIGDWVFCAPTDNYEVPAFGITLPEAGVYFNASYGVRSFHVAKCTRFPSTKLMDTKYLPMDDITAAVIAALPVYDGEVVTE